MPTEEQKKWMFKKENEIRRMFPEDPFSDDNVVVKFVEKLESVIQEANQNEIAKRWVLEILHAYQNRHVILTDEGHTDHEWSQALKKKYGWKGAFDGE